MSSAHFSNFSRASLKWTLFCSSERLTVALAWRSASAASRCCDGIGICVAAVQPARTAEELLHRLLVERSTVVVEAGK